MILDNLWMMISTNYSQVSVGKLRGLFGQACSSERQSERQKNKSLQLGFKAAASNKKISPTIQGLDAYSKISQVHIQGLALSHSEVVGFEPPGSRMPV